MGGSNQANAKFAPLVSLVSHIVQCMSMESMDDDTHTYLTFVSSTNPAGPRVRVSQKYLISEQALEFFTHPELMGLVLLRNF